MNVSKQLADALRPKLSGFRVTGYNTALEAVTGKLVMAYVERIEPTGQIGLNQVRVELGLWLLVGNEDSQTADKTLETALERLLVALQGIPWVEWTSAERGVLQESFHGYKLSLVVREAKIELED